MKTLNTLAFVIFFSCGTMGQTSSVNDHVRELLELSGSAKIGIQMMNNLIETYKKEVPSVPEEFWQELANEIKPDELIELLVPIYSKYFSEKEILELIKFYKSPIGRKMVGYMPAIVQDSYVAGQDWGRKISERAVAKLKEKGYISNN